MNIKKKCRSNQCLRFGIFENGICPKCIGLMNKSVKAKKQIKKASDRDYPKAFKEAKAAFQLLRRLQEADKNGVVICVHGSRKHYTRCDGGHYMPAHYKYHCFNPLNVHPQEKHKNMDMQNPITVMEYRSFLIKKIGIIEVEKIEMTYKMEKKYSTFELIEMAVQYRAEIERIKKEKNL